MPWHKLSRNRWEYREGEGRTAVTVTLQCAKSCGRGWRYQRAQWPVAWVYLGPAVKTLAEAQAATFVLIRLES